MSRSQDVLQCVAAFLFVFLAVTAPHAQAQVAFSSPQNVSNAPGRAHQIVVDAGGNINVLWLSTGSAPAVFFSRSSGGGAAFSAPKAVSNPSNTSSSPQMAIDPSGKIYVIWTEQQPGWRPVLFARSLDGGATFEPPQQVSAGQGHPAGGPQIAVDSSGGVNIVWVDNGPGYYDIFFRRSSDSGATFGPTENSGNSLGTEAVSVALDPAGTINAAWWAGSPGGTRDIYFSRSTDNGASFHNPFNLSNNTHQNPVVNNLATKSGAANNVNILWEWSGLPWTIGYVRSSDGVAFNGTFTQSGCGFPLAPRMALDSLGGVHIVWQKNCSANSTANETYYARSTDGGNNFGPATRLWLGHGATTRPQLAIDSSNNVNVVFHGRSPADGQRIWYMHSTDGGASFSSAQMTSGPGVPGSSRPEDAQIALDAAGNVYVIWVEDAGIFFSRSVGVSLSSVSVSPATVTGGGSSTATVTLSGPAPAGGAVVSLSSSDTSVATVPASINIPAGASSATFSVATRSVAASTTVTISAAFGGNTRTASLTVEPAPQGLSSLTVNPASVTGGTPSTGTVTLSAPVPAGGAVVSLSSSDSSVVGVPATVTVQQGATTATFAVSSNPVGVSTTVTISATLSGVTLTALFTVQPATLTLMTLNPTSVTGGGSATGTVILSGPAPAGGRVVSLSSSNSAVAAVPAAVTVLQGATTAAFNVTTNPVGVSTPVTISATLGGVIRTATLTVQPPILLSLTLNPSTVTAGNSSAGTVRLDGPAPTGGAVVSLASSNPNAASVPPSVTIPQGATSATFTVSTNVFVLSSTTVTISALYRGTTRTANLTVNPLLPLPSGGRLGLGFGERR